MHEAGKICKLIHHSMVTAYIQTSIFELLIMVIFILQFTSFLATYFPNHLMIIIVTLSACVRLSFLFLLGLSFQLHFSYTRSQYTV